jgi:hypothetical protein
MGILSRNCVMLARMIRTVHTLCSHMPSKMSTSSCFCCLWSEVEPDTVAACVKVAQEKGLDSMLELLRESGMEVDTV